MSRAGEGVAGSCGLGFGGRGELGWEDEGRGRIQDPPSSGESLTPAVALFLQPRPGGLVSARCLLSRPLLMSQVSPSWRLAGIAPNPRCWDARVLSIPALPGICCVTLACHLVVSLSSFVCKMGVIITSFGKRGCE